MRRLPTELFVFYAFSSQYLTKRQITRTYLSQHVTRIPVRDGRVRGTVFVPHGRGPFPAVVDLFGLVNGLVEFRAALLARHGIASLALAYYDYDDLPKVVDRVDLDYFEEAVDWLYDQDFACTSRGLGAVGVSQGGLIATYMATHLQRVTCAVIKSAGVYNLLLPPYYRGRKLGESLTTVPQMLKEGTTKSDGSVIASGMFMSFPSGPEYRCKIEEAEAKFLLLAGRAGECVPSWASEMVVDILKSHGKNNWEHYCLDGAGHLLEPPHSPLNPFITTPAGPLSAGGNKLEHARAQEFAWQKTIDFLKENLSHT